MRYTTVKEKEKIVAHKEIEEEIESAELRVTSEEARKIASLLRYVVSLNTTVGLVSPTERRLATPTYRAVELAALILEGKTFEEASREAEAAWTGYLQDDHRHALDLVQTTREDLQSATTERMGPKQFAEYLEISQEQLLELIKSGMLKPAKIPK
jgi:hypothetical protein